jgi:hypothetical protein
MATVIPHETANIARAYVEAVGHKQLDKVKALLAPDLEFIGPAMTLSSATELLTAFRRIGAILVRNEIRRIFVDGNEACVIYDFVTDTTLGTVPIVEWLRIEGGRICSVKVYYDRVPWVAPRAAQGNG